MTETPKLFVVPRARILVVDDNPSVREFIVRGLRSHGFEAEEAKDGRDALDLLATSSYHILISDVVMPHVDGVALATRARALYPPLKIIVLSGYARERDRVQNMASVADTLLAKPFALNDLVGAVERVLQPFSC